MPFDESLIQKLEHEATFMDKAGKQAVSRCIAIVRQHYAEVECECECDEISNGESCRKCGASPEERPTHTKSVTIGGLQYGGYRVDYD
jgi:hypothetical protein